MSHSLLQVIWYLLIGVLLTGYAILDGFDLGVGVLYPFVARDEGERRRLLNAIGPFWDGNEVWLLTAGGALFAAFPHAYATVFSGFYLVLMLMLFALITRAVSFEFRSRVASPAWRRAWDWAFFAGSLLPAFLSGVAVGNVVRGVPLDSQMAFTGTFLILLNPFALLVGVTSLAMFITHGAHYLLLKTEGAVATRAKRWAVRGWTALAALIVLVTVAASYDAPARFANKPPLIWVLPLLTATFMILAWINLQGDRAGRAFLFSALTIASLVAIWGAADFPYLLPARNVAAHGLTVVNASASRRSLMTMLIIALIGLPPVVLYTAYVYRLFRGKVSSEGEGY